MRAAVSLLGLVLAACGTTGTRTDTIEVPVIVKVPVTVAVPEGLTAPQPVYERKNGTVGEFRAQADHNTLQLRGCLRDKADIRALPTD